MGLHADITGADLHVPGYRQSSDPGAVGAGIYWVDTTGGTGAWELKIRNAGDSGWETLGGGGGGGASDLDDLGDVAIAAPAVGQELRYANGAFRNRLPFRLNLWDFILDQLAGSAYVPSYRIFGGSITSGAATFTTQVGQLTAAMASRAVTVDKAGSAGGTLTTTISAYTSGTSVTLAANASTTVSLSSILRTTDGTNVSAALNAALAAAGVVAAATPGGCILEVPSGVYLVDGNHAIPDNVWIEGAGEWRTVFMLKGGVSSNTDVFRTVGFASLTGTTSNPGCQGFALQRLTIDGNFRNNSNGRYGLAIYGFDYFLKDLSVVGCKNSGIYAEYTPSDSDSAFANGVGPGGVHAYWDRVFVQNCADSGKQVQVLGPHDSLIRGLDVYKDGSFSAHGIYTTAGGAQFSEVHVWGNHTIGFEFAAGSQQLINFQLEGANTQLKLAGSKLKVTGGRIYGFTGTSAVRGIEIASSDVHVADVQFENLDTSCVKFTSGGNNSTILGCHASSDGGASPPIIEGTIPATCRVEIEGTNGMANSVHKQSGHAVAAGDVAISAGWGTTASASVRAGSNVYRGEITVASSGTGQGANPTITLTFPKAFAATPYVLSNRAGTIVGGSSGFTASAVSTTSVTFIYGGTPSASSSYSLNYIVME